MKKFENDVFEKCKSIFEENDYYEGNSWVIDTHDGSSYDGFMSFCEGWVEAIKGLYYPSYGGARFENEKCQKIYENLCDTSYDEQLYYDDNTDGVKELYPNYEDFVNAITDPQNNDEYSLQEDVDETINRYRYESPAFLKVRLLFNDNTATLGVYLNDDLSYGRDSVGSWAGKNVIGEPFGNHLNYKESFTFESYDELYEWLDGALKRAQETYQEEDY